MSRRHWRRAVAANATDFPPLKTVRRIVVIQLSDVSLDVLPAIVFTPTDRLLGKLEEKATTGSKPSTKCEVCLGSDSTELTDRKFKAPVLPRSAISAINVVRRRMPVAVPTPGRARRAAVGLFGPRRVHPRTVAALPYRPGWCTSPDARAQTGWRLRRSEERRVGKE